MLEASEKFLVSDESGIAAEIVSCIQKVIGDESPENAAPLIYVKRPIGRTTAPHGLTVPEVKRLFNATHCMVRKRRQMWFATLGDGIQDMTVDAARGVVDAFLKALVTEQKSSGYPQYWLQALECGGGLNVHVVFVGSRQIVERLKKSARFGQYLHIRWTYDAHGLAVYLSKERTPQAQFGLGEHIGGARKKGSHRLPGGGDRIRLSEALKKDAIAAGYVEPWQKTNARRSAERKDPKPYRIRQGKAPKPSGQAILFPELEKLPARIREYHGGYMTGAQAREAEFRRQQLGLAQHQLAQLVGLSQPHYANVVRGHDSMSRHAAERLREALIPQQKEAA